MITNKPQSVKSKIPACRDRNCVMNLIAAQLGGTSYSIYIPGLILCMDHFFSFCSFRWHKAGPWNDFVINNNIPTSVMNSDPVTIDRSICYYERGEIDPCHFSCFIFSSTSKILITWKQVKYIKNMCITLKKFQILILIFSRKYLEEVENQ